MKWYEFLIVQLVVFFMMYLFMKRMTKDKSKSSAVITDDGTITQKLRKLRQKHLSLPLSETARPKSLSDIYGQDEAIAALRAAICGKNPQHVLIYGPPGVGKTCAARLLLEEAKNNPDSPFDESSKFIEVDATCVRFDERAIADPLLGCVHDPIYQGAGLLGSQGIPQPKPGAVTRAHCGILFLDEIGELHPMQMNKLLKVLEDRCVYLESSYYSKTNTNIPPYIHDIFRNGLPADFRLIGATTRSPEEIPPALRSRCIEIFFSPLSDTTLTEIGKRAAALVGKKADDDVLSLCASYSSSGRDCMNIMQLAGSLSASDSIKTSDIEWVASVCRYPQKYSFSFPKETKAGRAFGLGVANSIGVVFEIECVVRKNGSGKVTLNGIPDEEELEAGNRILHRKSLVLSSVENALCAVRSVFGIDADSYDIVFNIIGGIPIDGPSAGAAFCVAFMSALLRRPFRSRTAVTGEISANGDIHPVGGIREKVTAAKMCGAECICVPKGNEAEAYAVSPSIKAVADVKELLQGLVRQ